MFVLNKQVERQSAVVQTVWTKAVLQQIRVLNIRGWRDSLIGFKMSKEAHCLWNNTIDLKDDPLTNELKSASFLT